MSLNAELHLETFGRDSPGTVLDSMGVPVWEQSPDVDRDPPNEVAELRIGELIPDAAR